jgi:hypothetical protein
MLRCVPALGRPYSAAPTEALHGRRRRGARTMRRVRVLAHIKKLDDCFGQFLVRVTCKCGAVREIKPEALARIVGWSATIEQLAHRMRCSQCGKKAADVVAVARPRRRVKSP